MSLKDKFIDYRPSAKLLNAHLPKSSRKTRIVSASALFFAVCAFGAYGVAPIEPDTSDIHIKAISQDLALPSLQQQVEKLSNQDQLYVAEGTMRTSDTLASLMTRLGIDDSHATNFIKTDSVARAVMRLPAGSTVQAQTDANGGLQWLRASLPDAKAATTKANKKDPTAADSTSVQNDINTNVNNIIITRRDDKFSASQQSVALEKRIEMHSGVIRTSLFAATDAADIPDTISSQLIDIFGTNINFANDIKRGDSFNIAYETFWQNGQFVRTGKILAGEFINGGKTYQSVWFDDPKSAQGGGYYGFDGKSMKQAFLKSPLTYTRISSGFSMRLHPILGTWKKHEGVDFAAPTGTPIHAASDGVVDFAGVQNGYGNVVILKHANNIATVYGHMSRFAGLRKGNKVTQGEVIGYVGMTGWATGPHLHYEFRVADKPLDPMTVTLPNAQALTGNKLQRFQTVASDMSHRFALLQAKENTPFEKKMQLAAK